jgi:prepilin-type N-terminal cleavage/methylation domain-containing protein/prepilin-type processing-associated H-X9-DG protein
MRFHRTRFGGFTLVELLVVIAIIGVLVALLLPAVQAAREAARRSQCSNNLKQIGLGLLNYESAVKTFPPGEIAWNNTPTSPCSGSSCKFHSWSSMFLPYIEEQSIHDQIDFTRDMKLPPNWQPNLTGPVNKVIRTYVCPSIATRQKQRGDDNRLRDFNGNGYSASTGEGLACIDYIGIPGPAKSIQNVVTGVNYLENAGVLLRHVSPSPGVMAVKAKHITDGMSKTAIVAESSGRGVGISGSAPNWTDDFTKLDGAWSANDNCSPIKFPINWRPVEETWTDQEIWSDHPGGAHMLMCDGSVHFVSEDVDLNGILAPICSRSGGESVDLGAAAR